MNDKPSAGAENEFRSGFVALLGEPNVGKSTLLNAILDFKVAIVSHKPQTTRDRIAGIYTDDSRQIVFIDTPGVMEPRDRFNECLRDRALEAVEGADVVYHLVEAPDPRPLPPAASAALERLDKPVLLVANKSDRILGKGDWEGGACAALWGEKTASFNLELYRGVFFISALRRKGLEPLLDATRALLPVGPPLYDPDQMTDRDLRFLASEIVREKILEHVHQEVPYAVATRTEEFREREGGKRYVRVAIFVEHDSQKAIVVGKGGAMLRQIGSAARPEIEALAEHPVYLELWVKVRKNWRKRDSALREFGFRPRTRKQKRG
ncbi:MAG TPA: GTPase Era [Sumerlaeia bacterium]|nr:GTPase Era [Sumerlaeia bacterium]